jgi:hypothetical protein
MDLEDLHNILYKGADKDRFFIGALGTIDEGKLLDEARKPLNLLGDEGQSPFEFFWIFGSLEDMETSCQARERVTDLMEDPRGEKPEGCQTILPC